MRAAARRALDNRLVVGFGGTFVTGVVFVAEFIALSVVFALCHNMSEFGTFETDDYDGLPCFESNYADLLVIYDDAFHG